MLHDGQELDVRKPHALDIGNQLGGQLAPRQLAIAFVRVPAPGPGMQLVDGDRAMERILVAPCAHPCGIPPLVVAKVGGHRRGSRRVLGRQGERIGFEERRPDVWMDLELVRRALGYTWDEELPQAARAEVVERVRAAVPPIELTDHRHASCVRRPHHKAVPGDALALGRPGAHLLPRAQPVAFAEEIRLVIRNDAAGIRGLRLERHARTVSKICWLSNPVHCTAGSG